MNTRVFFLAAAVAAGSALAQTPPDEMPAELPSEQPAVTPGAAAPKAGDAGVVQAPGMSIIGDQESPIGLYIIPWRSSAAQTGLDRPARLLDDSLTPLDPDVFHRQVIYNAALADKLRETGRVTPK
ncbi:MAG TPA: hypothetical protein VM369_05040 [Candidatus Binatia bacterium]|nr:hypothetical protein [Candidatus Binatia bacterium]